jgi:urocanate hydratase
VVTAGLGGMGGAQPLAITMNGGVALIAEVDPQRIQRRLETGYLDRAAGSISEGLTMATEAAQRGEAVSIAVCANAVDLCRRLATEGPVPDVLTDQTSAHDLLNGYIPAGVSYEEALDLRRDDPERYLAMAASSVVEHVDAMLQLQQQGAITFDYGNNIRQQALEAGLAEAFQFPGFVPAYIRPLFAMGRPFSLDRPFRRPAGHLSHRRADARPLPEGCRAAALDPAGAGTRPVPGLPARICWLGYGDRAKAGLAINELVRNGEISAPS